MSGSKQANAMGRLPFPCAMTDAASFPKRHRVFGNGYIAATAVVLNPASAWDSAWCALLLRLTTVASTYAARPAREPLSRFSSPPKLPAYQTHRRNLSIL